MAFEYIIGLDHVFFYNNDPKMDGTRSLATSISLDMAVVLPKSVTPTVGCTVRSLSHNLSLLPPTGQAGARWVYAPHSMESDRLPLNILVVPIPYFFHANVFQEVETCQQHGWGFFSVQPRWLEGVSKADFVKFIGELCWEAASKANKVDAIIFPEMAINEELFNALRDEIASATRDSIFHQIEFVVAGLCDRKQTEGNFVGCAVFSGAGQKREGISLVRAKHHRWKVEKEQIKTYRLSHMLNQSLNWWEALPPRSREIHFFRFRNSSSFTALICEDLARIDPCQEVLRSVGPDLIISILMDSAQIDKRWPARYATVLAEDPGSSVLTITSKALIERSNVRRLEEEVDLNPGDLSTSIGLWKDSSIWGGQPISLPHGYSAVLLTLANEKMGMRTLDGRTPHTIPKWSWRLTDQRPIKLTPERRIGLPDFGWNEDPINHDDL